MFQHILDAVKGTDIEQVAQIMTLRSMQQAKYSIDNAGHFWVGVEMLHALYIAY